MKSMEQIERADARDVEPLHVCDANGVSAMASGLTTTAMHLVTVIGKGDFGREIERFVCSSESAAYAEANVALIDKARLIGEWLDFSVEKVEVR